MITMGEVCRSNPKATVFVILIASAAITYCISRYLALNSSIVFIQNGNHLKHVAPGLKAKTRNRHHKSRPNFPSLNATRVKVKNEIQEFLRFIHKNESQLIPELGGVPIRCMLSTTWRSGSTFTGRSLTNHPGAIEFYEPLRRNGNHRKRSLSKAHHALWHLENQLRCNYTALKRQRSILPKAYRKRWFGKAKNKPSLEEISSYCSLYPVQIIKILRLGSRLLKRLLEDTSLNLRVILMVRDPRALLNSRKRVDFCHGECKNAAIICQDYYDDYKVLKELERTFPGRIMGIRFEDITSNPEKVIPELYDFCGLHSSESLQEFISAHTKPDNKGYERPRKFNTFRNTSKVSFEWKQNLLWTEIDKIQRACAKAMDVWGYNQVDKDNVMNVETFTRNIP